MSEENRRWYFVGDEDGEETDGGESQEGYVWDIRPNHASINLEPGKTAEEYIQILTVRAKSRELNFYEKQYLKYLKGFLRAQRR